MRSFWILFNIIFWTIVLGLLGIFVSLIERRGKFVGWVTRTWSKIILWSVAVTYSVKGLENLDPDEHYVFVANHESALDIPLAFALLPYHMVAITKKELKKIPIFGWVLAMSGFIFVDRSRHEKAMASLDAAAESLKNNPRSILLFPEGTRSTDGQIKTFKKGGLMLGAKAGLRVVPMACCGTGDTLKKKNLKMTGSQIQLRVGKPLDVNVSLYSSPRTFAEHVRSQVVNLKDSWKAEQEVS